MRKIAYIFISTLLISTLAQAQSKTNSPESGKQINSKKETQKSIQATEKFTRLDSIEKANNASVVASGNNITKAFIFLKDGDSTIHLTSNIRRDHRIFGYSEPDIKSDRLLLLSVFTSDVENNPFGCKLGAYYDTGGMTELKIKYISTFGSFVKATVIDKDGNSTTIYLEKKWIDFE